MKSYYDYMREISPSELLDGLLGYGLFTDKLPDVFTGESFLQYCKNCGSLPFGKQGYDYVRFRAMRNTGFMRDFAVPNPIPYAHLCLFLHDNWINHLLPYFNQTTSLLEFSYSQIHIQKINNCKSLFRLSLSYCDKDSQTISLCENLKIGKHYRVCADIANCFPSIYSHSLAWALVGKPTAKASKGNQNAWYNKLDKFSRLTKNNETNGLLIGPHASNLLSEIVLSDIDRQMQLKGYRYIRNIDDCECYVESYDKAQAFILDFAKILAEYDLKINEKKIKIEKLPIEDENWVTQLNSFYFGSDKTKNGKIILYKNRLSAFLSLAKKMALNSNNHSVYLYAIKMIHDMYLGARAKEYLMNEMHSIILTNTYLAPYFAEHLFDNFAIDKEQIKPISKNLYNEGIRTNNFEACSYALFWALKYGYILSSDITHKMIYDDSLKSNDCIFLLLAFLYAKKNREGTYTRKYKDFASIITDIDRYWYFIYEVLDISKLPNQEMKTLKKAKVSFVRKEYIK